jgi:hypothetical protein
MAEWGALRHTWQVMGLGVTASHGVRTASTDITATAVVTASTVVTVSAASDPAELAPTVTTNKGPPYRNSVLPRCTVPQPLPKPIVYFLQEEPAGTQYQAPPERQARRAGSSLSPSCWNHAQPHETLRGQTLHFPSRFLWTILFSPGINYTG